MARLSPPEQITLIGAGRMGSAMVAGWLERFPDLAITVGDPSPPEQVKNWADSGKVTLNPPPTPAPIVVLAVKPQIFAKVADSLKPWIDPRTIVISVMAGISIQQIADDLGAARIVRAMPNTPGAIGRGVTVLFERPGDDDPKAIPTARQLLAPLGQVEGPLSEDLMPAVIATSGSSPAYVFLMAELLAKIGAKQGLPEDLAKRIAIGAVAGSGALMAETGTDPAELRRNVTSPGGTTQAALEVLMASEGMPSLLERAMKACADRDKALARGE